MKYIIGDLGYTSEACSTLLGLIRDISERGNLEDFVKFKIELDLAIDNRDSLSYEERKAVSECMEKDNYFEDLGTGEYLDEIKELENYTEHMLSDDCPKDDLYNEENLLREIFLEGLYEIEDYIKEGVEQANFEADERENILREYEDLTSNDFFKGIR